MIVFFKKQSLFTFIPQFNVLKVGVDILLLTEIRESFHIIDTDGDGLATREQIERLVYKVDPEMSEEEMLDLLDTADLDGTT